MYYKLINPTCDTGSVACKVNLAVTEKPKSSHEIAGETGLNATRVGIHLRWLMEKGCVVETKYRDYNQENSTGSDELRMMEQELENARSEAQTAVSKWRQVNEQLGGLQQAVKGSAQIIKDLQEKLKESGKEVVVGYRVVELDGSERTILGQFNKVFPKVLALATARKNIFIYGPTGTGKSYLARQLAEVLGLRFAFVSCTTGMSEGHLGGKLLPLGEHGRFTYVISEFINAYENGGVFLLDEVDAADANVMLFINAALANGRVALSNRPENPYAFRHKDFICIAAANTLGTGGDRMYAGRNKLDMSTLDRFAVGKVFLDYDTGVENRLVETWSPNKELLEWCWKVRKAIGSHRLERAMSTRFILDSYEMMYGVTAWTQQDLEESYFAGWREDEVNKVRSELRHS